MQERINVGGAGRSMPLPRRYPNQSTSSAADDPMKDEVFQSLVCKLYMRACTLGICDAKSEYTHKTMVQVMQRRIIEVYQVRLPADQNPHVVTASVQMPDLPDTQDCNSSDCNVVHSVKSSFHSKLFNLALLRTMVYSGCALLYSTPCTAL